MRSRLGRQARWAACVCLTAITAAAHAADPPPADDFLVIPLRAHVLRSADLSDVDCNLTDPDVRRVVAKVNAIWRPAGICWDLEAIVREPAARQADFKARREVRGPAALDLFRMLAPESTKVPAGLHVYYIHKFAVNGVYLGERTAFVQETAKLRPVEGGIDEPLPRVTAHELGHALGLPHRQDRTNLLASGNNGTSLNAAEVERAREHARKVEGVRTVADLRRDAKAAEASGDLDTARRLREVIEAIGVAESDPKRPQSSPVPTNLPER